MAQSERFSILKLRITELREHLLPEEFSDIGEYTSKEQDMAKGFRLLSHAEFESYLEDVSKDIVLESIRKWRRDKKPTMTMISFLAAYHSSWSVNDETHNEEIIELARKRTDPQKSLMDAVDVASQQFLRKISSNHGVKAKNFKTLIFPTGLDTTDISDDLYIKLDSFGAKRGDIAHKSAKVTTEINPKDELEMVIQLLNALEELDEKLLNLD
ncbi:HEPN domain-containing protein [Serratia ureilytica]|uniref:HEPN domain-containing protein n=1 Tax=Serratia ureilytica TaxID=300181 RepID=UPI001C1E2AD2|nr:HEPN domain-containing protein [Serratia ureilytica]QWU35637.1 hypothetical protein KQJ82_23110 [Serratia ureilytica]UUW16499.1 HEPN domain-containing protein [Serratia ureilytica]